MTANDASILNYGVDKTLISAQNTSSSYGNLTMTANNGTIGLEVQETACTGANCTGVGPKTEGARDFKKSINAIVKNKVKATTTDSSAAKNTDYVINYASIDSDMNIDTIKADGRVILTVDNSGHAWGGEATATSTSGKRYDMLNARTSNNDTNVEGWGMSLISNGSIGTKNKPVTFIQNKAETNSMDVLANNNVYLRENSYNDSDYGAAKETKVNKVCTMIAREGDMDVEFAGDTDITNVTAEGDMKIVTRGQKLNIKNLVIK
jgi:hypothetical protein